MSAISRGAIGQRMRRAGLSACILLIADTAAVAQQVVTGVANAVQGFSENRDQPVQIEADALELRDKKKLATFSGHVRVVQGDTVMTSTTLKAFYEKGPARPPSANRKAAARSAPLRSATPGPNGSSSIRRLEASGDVVVTKKDQVVTGQTAVFDTRADLISVLGGVVLTQCRNVVRGDRLRVDMTTGLSRVESDSGKVHALLSGAGAGCDVPKPDARLPAEPGASIKPK